MQTKRINSDSFAVLTDDDGLLLALMKDTQANYPKSFHIGFFQESNERVYEINQQLKDDDLM